MVGVIFALGLEVGIANLMVVSRLVAAFLELLLKLVRGVRCALPERAKATTIGLLVLLGLITAAVRWYRSHAPQRTGMMPRMTHEIEFEAFRPLSSQ